MPNKAFVYLDLWLSRRDKLQSYGQVLFIFAVPLSGYKSSLWTTRIFMWKLYCQHDTTQSSNLHGNRPGTNKREHFTANGQ